MAGSGAGGGGVGETKVIYHLDEEETPYLVKIPVPAERITLGDFKSVLQRPAGAKYFFKSMDQDFGVVKEEISDDNARLPCFNGRVVSWLVSSDNPQPEMAPPAHEPRTDLAPPPPPLPPLPPERTSGIGDSRPPSFHPNVSSSRENLEPETETESVVSLRRERPRRRDSSEHGAGGHRPSGPSRLERHLAGYESSSTLMTSELESTSLGDSDEDDTMSRFSSSTEQSSASRLLKRHRRRRKQRPPRLERASSFSSVTDSTMSLNIITVTLNMEKYNFLGISIVGQSNERGDGGIYIGSIMKGGAVAADGRIEPGDMLLQVNDMNFENMSNDDAVRVLRDIVHKPGPIVLTVAKCWDPSPQAYFTLPRNEPIQPIDPAAWVSHSAALTGTFPAYPGSSSMSTITSGSSLPDGCEGRGLSIHTDMASVTKAMAAPESGLEVRDRMWLKITIPNAFLGSDVVDWLYHHVEGFPERREARKYASGLLKAGLIRHTVNKITFSEQCYYVFGDLSGGCESCECPCPSPDLVNLSLNDNDGSSGASDQDTLAPLPGATPWPLLPTFSYQYPAPHPYSPQPPPYHELSSYTYGGGSASSQHSEGSRSSGSTRSDGGAGRTGRPEDRAPESKSGSGSESEPSSRGGSLRRGGEAGGTGDGGPPPSRGSSGGAPNLRAHPGLHPYGPPPGMALPYNPMMVVMMPPPPPPVPPAVQPPGAPPVRDLGSVPPELTASRQSFHMAMGNPSEFFVDVM
ncbi:segment polarity protein dishevelled homolog DVL-2 isoform X2 [Cervus elaphus]|uniref:segment polarity protein dishevelled homolog DVL-2 isoform X2 n=1 Tax=Cervus canadensis TaxID=1574408 RepID=UPI001C9E443F|nr:segment polarity protein dishevelled homolog DVL-2 isoform X2 [Cervus canadensis]XP_043759566.1 segment polarity protein dishevelled homolog DVL-2 isoform X2 [Cervus elaphus]